MKRKCAQLAKNICDRPIFIQLSESRAFSAVLESNVQVIEISSCYLHSLRKCEFLKKLSGVGKNINLGSVIARLAQIRNMDNLIELSASDIVRCIRKMVIIPSSDLYSFGRDAFSK